jgi:hypothetical protein
MTTATRPYPVTLKGDLTVPPGRWQWLFKWLLVFPHNFILFFLMIAAGVLMVVAFFAILFTGKYPRSMFDFVQGVMRWSWRVSFYSYSALGTDKYPPFSLDSDPNYPADLTIQYPEKLNNGLVLVKWLLAFPHWVIIWIMGYIQPLLILVSAIVLLFTGKYLPELFKIIMGINRWMYRVYAYLEMTDVYPPFSFWDDLGIGLAQ